MAIWNSAKERSPIIRHSGGLERKTRLKGWVFILPAIILIAPMAFYPMVEAFLLSLQAGKGNALHWTGFSNYLRLPKDRTFLAALNNTFLYLIVQVPIMLLLALILATMLNDKTLKFKGIYRTLIFLPCATSLVSASIVFRQLFDYNGLLNTILMHFSIISEPIPFMTDPNYARMVIIVTMLWRWTGYNMIFYLAGLQNIDKQVYEAAGIDGASVVQQFFHITIPLLRPFILLTTILSTSGTLQLFDEVRIMTNGGPANATVSLSYHIYDLSFLKVPQFGYAATVAYVVFILVAILSLIQLKVGDKS
jgi:lactose/L-arabinose transport system permease protein